MKHSMFAVLIVFFSSLVQGQPKFNNKSWIKVSSQDLSGTNAVDDTAYSRYTFDKDNVYVSLEPAWDGFTVKWQSTDDGMRIGFQDYQVAELTDTSMVLIAPGFRRTKLLAEDYLRDKSEKPMIVDTINGKVIYLATKMVTARYQKGKSLSNELEKYSHGYNIRELSTLRIEFVVNEKGLVQNVKLIKGITEGLDKAMMEAITKTSKKWKPAQYDGKPIPVLMFFESRFINTAPGGILNRQ